MADKDEARRELARRELARRKGADQPSMVGDLVKSVGAGIRSGVEGMTALPGDLNRLGGQGASWLAEQFGASPETASTVGNVARRMSVFGGMPTGEQVAANANEAIGDTLKHTPQTTLGEYGKTAGEFLPAAMAGPGGIGRRLVTQALLPAMGSETAGQATEGTAMEPYARFAGGLAGGVAPTVIGRAISPMRISPERQAIVQSLQREGVDLTAGQQSGSNKLRYMESELGGAAGQRMMERQGEQFTDAAMRRAGAGGRATTDNMAAMEARLGQGFDDVSARNTVQADQRLADDMSRAMQEYATVLPEAQRDTIFRLGQNIVDRFRQGGGRLAGDLYQKDRSRLSRMAKNSRQSDPDYSNALREMRNALDDAMTRSVRPEDAQQWQQLRREYGNMKTLERAATGAGENAAQGIISPAQLRNAATAGRRGQYARGEGDFDQLARAGEATMKPLPNSGTASRMAARGVTSLPGILGAIAGGQAGDVGMMLAGGLAGAAVPAAAGRALMSGPVQRYLTNQLASGVQGLDPRTAAIISALMNRQGTPALPSP